MIKILQPSTFNLNNWYALYTRSRHEMFVESNLLKKGIETFTPKTTLKKKWSDRVKHVEVPLFKSYCFARFSLEDKVKVISQKGVVSVVHIKGKYIPVEDSVINSLKILIENKVKFDPCPYLKVGDKVTIKKGPLKGVEGYIEQKRKKNTVLVVSIDTIASSISCIIDMDCVE